MHDPQPVLGLDGVEHAVAAEPALVAELAAATGVEGGGVEFQGLVADGGHGCLELAQVRVLAVEQMGAHGSSFLRI
ncbi:hypothetical protein ACWEJQ_18315 [Streptomyces albidoflavus]